MSEHVRGGVGGRKKRQSCAPRIAVEISQLAVLGMDLGGVDLGVVGEDVLPPLLLVELLEVEVHGLLVDFWVGGQRGLQPGDR